MAWRLEVRLAYQLALARRLESAAPEWASERRGLLSQYKEEWAFSSALAVAVLEWGYEARL